MSQLQKGLVPFGPNANCSLDLCPLEASILQYQPSIPASSLAIGGFGLSLLLHVFQGSRSGTWGFMGSMIIGCLLEIAGYVGRLIMHNNPFDFGGFLMQIICITIAPVFFCSAIYVLLSQIIDTIDTSISRFEPRLLYWVFIPCDIISLILQAVGGALSCVGTTKDDIQVGVDVSLAGLIFQVITLFLFGALFVDYSSSCWRSARISITPRMVFFLHFLFLSVIIILLRCVYRIVELHEGYFSELFRDEALFIALESGAMCVAVLLLNVSHPGLVLDRKTGGMAQVNKDHATPLVPIAEDVEMDSAKAKKSDHE